MPSSAGPRRTAAGLPNSPSAETWPAPPSDARRLGCLCSRRSAWLGDAESTPRMLASRASSLHLAWDTGPTCRLPERPLMEGGVGRKAHRDMEAATVRGRPGCLFRRAARLRHLQKRVELIRNASSVGEQGAGGYIVGGREVWLGDDWTRPDSSLGSMVHGDAGIQWRAVGAKVSGVRCASRCVQVCMRRAKRECRHAARPRNMPHPTSALSCRSFSWIPLLLGADKCRLDPSCEPGPDHQHKNDDSKNSNTNDDRPEESRLG